VRVTRVDEPETTFCAAVETTLCAREYTPGFTKMEEEVFVKSGPFTVKVCEPAVFNVMEKLLVPLLRVALAGSRAAGSFELNVTAPANPVTVF
jgi:hypothetical protein